MRLVVVEEEDSTPPGVDVRDSTTVVSSVTPLAVLVRVVVVVVVLPLVTVFTTTLSPGLLGVRFPDCTSPAAVGGTTGAVGGKAGGLVLSVNQELMAD